MSGPARTVLLDLEYVHRKLTKTRYIYIAKTKHCGFGIFAAASFPQGRIILADEDGDYYDGAITEAQVRMLGLDLSTHCFQIDHDRYLLPHGSIDDLINHSCSPNAGIRLTAKGYHLIALRDIEIGEELTYDYSTYISNPRDRMRCACGSAACRGEVGPFYELPPRRRAFYLEHGVVGAFAVAGIPAQPAARAEAAHLAACP